MKTVLPFEHHPEMDQLFPGPLIRHKPEKEQKLVREASVQY